MAKLTEHFSKFGPIVNIQIKFHQKQAQVEFATRGQALAAYRSPDAVLGMFCNRLCFSCHAGNRFIKVFWADKFKGSKFSGEDSKKPPVSETLTAEQIKVRPQFIGHAT